MAAISIKRKGPAPSRGTPSSARKCRQSRAPISDRQRKRNSTALTLDEAQPFPFLKLPNEIQNMVFIYMFVVYTTITAKSSDDSNNNSNDKINDDSTDNSNHDVQQDILVEGTARALRWSLQPPYTYVKTYSTHYHPPKHPNHHKPASFNAAIFRADRSTSRDARSVFYGNNTFRFGRTTTLRTFLTCIGPSNARFLRKIHIAGPLGYSWAYTSARVALPLVARLEALESVHVDLRNVMVHASRVEMSVNGMAWRLRPLFEGLWERSGGDIEVLFRIVKFGNDGEGTKKGENVRGGDGAGMNGGKQSTELDDKEPSFPELVRAVVESYLLPLPKPVVQQAGHVRKALRRSARAKRVDYAETGDASR